MQQTDECLPHSSIGLFMKKLSLLSAVFLLQSCSHSPDSPNAPRSIASNSQKIGCHEHICAGDSVVRKNGFEVNAGFGVVKEIYTKKKERFAKVEFKNKKVVDERIYSFAKYKESSAGQCKTTPSREYCFGEEMGIFVSDENKSDKTEKMKIVALPDNEIGNYDFLLMSADKRSYSYTSYPLELKKGECSSENICVGLKYDNGFGSTDEVVGLFDEHELYYRQGISYLVKLGDFDKPMLKRIPMDLLKKRMTKETSHEITMPHFFMGGMPFLSSDENIEEKVKAYSYDAAKQICARDFYSNGVLDEDKTTIMPDLSGDCEKDTQWTTTVILPVLAVPTIPTNHIYCKDVNWKFTCTHKKR